MRLQLQDGPGGLRHLLGGRLVQFGAELEVWLPRAEVPGGGLWIRGMYRWNFIVGHPAMLEAPGVVIMLAPEAVLRWPAARERAA